MIKLSYDDIQYVIYFCSTKVSVFYIIIFYLNTVFCSIQKEMFFFLFPVIYISELYSLFEESNLIRSSDTVIYSDRNIIRDTKQPWFPLSFAPDRVKRSTSTPRIIVQHTYF